MPTPFRLVAVMLAAVLLLPATAAVAQTDDDPPADDTSLPDPPDGTVGQLLQPIEDLLDQLLGALNGTDDDPVADQPAPNAAQLTGTTAVEAAAALSRATFPAADTVLIARDDLHPDALASVAAQGLAGAPLLLTDSQRLSSATATEIQRLGATHAVILGGTTAVAEWVTTALQTAGLDVTRVGGPTRIETAALVADTLADDPDTVVLVRAHPDAGGDDAQGYVDALAVGPLASTNRWPVLLTDTDTLSSATAAYLDDHDIDRVVVIGGTDAIGSSVTRELTYRGHAVDRIAGTTRYETAVEIANAAGYDTAADASRIIVVEGLDATRPLWAPGFASAAHAAVYDGPVLLTAGDDVPHSTQTFLLQGTLDDVDRTTDEPVLCNAFVADDACMTVAAIMAGEVQQADGHSDGATTNALSALVDDIGDLLDSILAGGLSDDEVPLVGDLLTLLGDGTLPGGPTDPSSPDAVVLSVLELLLGGDTDIPDELGVVEQLLEVVTTLLSDPDQLPTEVEDLVVSIGTLLDGLLGDGALPGDPGDPGDPTQDPTVDALLQLLVAITSGDPDAVQGEVADLLDAVTALLDSLGGDQAPVPGLDGLDGLDALLGPVTDLLGGDPDDPDDPDDPSTPEIPGLDPDTLTDLFDGLSGLDPATLTDLLADPTAVTDLLDGLGDGSLPADPTTLLDSLGDLGGDGGLPIPGLPGGV